jgi:hypothetical protein
MVRLAIVLSFCLVCGFPSLSFGGPITSEEAVQIAKREMNRRGISIRARPHIRVDKTLTKDIGGGPFYHSYQVTFSGVGQKPYGVSIDQRSGKVEWCEEMVTYEIPVRD